MLDEQTVSTLLILIITVSFVIILERVRRSKTMNTSCEQKLEHCCDDDNPIDDSTDVDAVDSLSMCANCGKGEENSGDLKACNACKMVKYCNRDCQIAHRPQHKKECKKRAAELHDEALFKEHPPPDDCPICMLPLPYVADSVNPNQTNFKSCCGYVICNGCVYEMGESHLCPMCRVPSVNCSVQEDIKRLEKLTKKGNAEAFNQLGTCYDSRYCEAMGVPQDVAKANSLFLKAGELGCSTGYYNLGQSYLESRGVRRDMKKAYKYWELAAMMGNISGRYNLGVEELKAGNHHRAYKHFVLAARAGDIESLERVKKGFMNGFVTKDEYANALRVHQERQNEIKSEKRKESDLISARNSAMYT